MNKKEGLTSFYDMRIYLDNKLIGIISSGNEFEFDVPTGQHKLRAKEGAFGSKDFSFTILNKDKRIFTVANNYSGCLFLIAGFILVAGIVGIIFDEPSHLDSLPLITTILGSLVFAIYVIVFHNNFLVIKEEGQE